MEQKVWKEKLYQALKPFEEEVYRLNDFMALDGLGFRWKGKSSHASAAPEKGRNALNAARLFMDAAS